MEDWILYKRLNDIEAIDDEKIFLKTQGIRFQIEDSSFQFDATFSNNSLLKEKVIKVHPADFEKLKISNQLEDIDVIKHLKEEGHYLLSFTEDELIEILKTRDEWSTYDFELAQILLKSKGIEYSETELIQFKEDRIELLSRPEKGDSGWIFGGYALAICGGWIGMGVGLNYILSKTTLPNGKKIHQYDKQTRQHGRNMLYIAMSVYILILFAILAIGLF